MNETKDGPILKFFPIQQENIIDIMIIFQADNSLNLFYSVKKYIIT